MANYSTPLEKFKQQRRQAKQRGIEWQMAFEEWFAVWQESGHWDMRGKKRGCYVMARHGDIGPYSRENVAIKLFSENIAEAHELHRRVGKQINLGSGRGWTYRAKSVRRPYQVVVANKYVGTFATQAEAEAAYQLAVCEIRDLHKSHFSPRKPINANHLCGASL